MSDAISADFHIVCDDPPFSVPWAVLDADVHVTGIDKNVADYVTVLNDKKFRRLPLPDSMPFVLQVVIVLHKCHQTRDPLFAEALKYLDTNRNVMRNESEMRELLFPTTRHPVISSLVERIAVDVSPADNSAKKAPDEKKVSNEKKAQDVEDDW